MTGWTAPGLLLAMPRLPDPVFARTVVLLVEHDERGSFGLILNRPTDTLLCETLRKEGIDWSDGTEHVVWDGGPVVPEPHEPDGFILHHPASPPAGDSEDFTAGFRLYPFPPEDEILAALTGEPRERLRFFLGYSAWGPGQLERELLQDTWLLLPPDPALVFHTPPEVMWETGFHSLGVEPNAIAPSHGLH